MRHLYGFLDYQECPLAVTVLPTILFCKLFRLVIRHIPLNTEGGIFSVKTMYMQHLDQTLHNIIIPVLPNLTCYQSKRSPGERRETNSKTIHVFLPFSTAAGSCTSNRVGVHPFQVMYV